MISKYLSYAVRLGYIPYNPCHSIPAYQNKEEFLKEPQLKFWEVSEFKIFIAAVDDQQWHDIFMFLFFTGLREAEMFALQWKDIDFQNCTITIKKSITYKTMGGSLEAYHPKKQKLDSHNRFTRYLIRSASKAFRAGKKKRRVHTRLFCFWRY